MTLPPIAAPARARKWFWPVLGAIVVVALGIRVAYVAAAKRGPCPVIVDGKVVAHYPSECTVGDQIFYNAEANSVAQGHGFVEPLWSVTHPGEKAPPAADHPPLTVFVLTPVSWLLEHGPISWVIDDDVGCARTRTPLHDGVPRHRSSCFSSGCSGVGSGGDWVGVERGGDRRGRLRTCG